MASPAMVVVTTADTQPQQSQIDVAASDLPGDGSESNPYEISNVSELQAMEDDLDANYELVSDIDASQTAQFNDGRGFDPVGPSFSAQFAGSLDGTNHTITGLTIDRPTENRIGVIGVLANEGTIRNVSVVDADITGNFYTGGIVGTTNGEVVSSSVTGTVTSSSNNAGGLAGSNDGLLRESSARVTVTGENQVGGLVGSNSDTIQNSSATGSVSASRNRVGGLVATNNNNATVENSYATGAVTGDSKVGGLVGLNPGIIQQTFAVGSVSGTSAVGGLVGTNTASFAETPGTVENSYFDELTTGQSTSAGSATGLTTAEMQGQAAKTNMSGFDFQTTWTTTSGYPALRAMSGTNESAGSGGGDDPIQVDIDPGDLPGDGTSSNPYEISNVSELQAMEDDLDANYELVSDIDASDTAQFNDGAGFDPVGNSGSEFNGSVDGNDHTVTGLTINRSDNSGVGLFGVTGNGAIVTDVTLTEIAVTGKNNVGGIVGFNDGTITASSAGGKLSGSNQVGGLVGFNRGAIQRAQTSVDMTAIGTGGDDVGGLVGFNIGTIRRAQASGNVTAIGTGGDDVGGVVGENNGGTIQNATASGNVTAIGTGGDDVGGVAGSNGGTLRNATASGNVSGTEEVGGVAGSNDGTVRAATASGSVTGTDVVGGLIGSNTGTITNVTASGNVTGIDEVGGVVGDNTGVITASTGAGNVNGSDGIGGLVGDNDGEGTDDGIISRSTASGEVTGGDKVGGLVGSNLGGEINVSVATGSVIIQSSQTDNSFPRAGGLVGGNFRGGVINQSYAKTVVSGGGNERRIGGLVGENFNQTGSDPSRILNSYASGPVSGSNQGEVGGLVGGNFRASRVVDSYWDTEETEQSTSAGSATGLTTPQMQGQAAKTNMSGLDFENTWTTTSEYPALRVLSNVSESTPESEQNPVIVGDNPATDPNGDGQLEDINGDGEATFEDAIALAFNTGAASVTENPESFDFDRDGDVDFDDAIDLAFAV